MCFHMIGFDNGGINIDTKIIESIVKTTTAPIGSITNKNMNEYSKIKE